MLAKHRSPKPKSADRHRGPRPIKENIMSNGGKGSTPRPFSVDRETFEQNWDSIFKKPKKKTEAEQQAEAWLKNEYYDLDIDID